MGDTGMQGMGGMEHSAALAGLIWLPVVIVGVLFLLQTAAAASPLAARTVAALAASRADQRAVALLMLMSSAVHLALVPVHAGEPVTAALFAVDGVALAVLAAGMVVAPGLRAIRAAAALVLTSGVLAYGFYLVAGIETLDAVGAVTKVIELAAIALCIAQPANLKFLEVSRS